MNWCQAGAERAEIAGHVRRRNPHVPGRPSIAVVPFLLRATSAAKSYFGDGIVEDIVGALASTRELFVISRSSTLRYRGATVDVRAVGRDLDASYALSGSVRRAGPRIAGVRRAPRRLAGAPCVWASHFDGISEDLFALQDEIATAGRRRDRPAGPGS